MNSAGDMHIYYCTIVLLFENEHEHEYEHELCWTCIS